MEGSSVGTYPATVSLLSLLSDQTLLPGRAFRRDLSGNCNADRARASCGESGRPSVCRRLIGHREWDPVYWQQLTVQ